MKMSSTTMKIISIREKKIAAYQSLLKDNLIGAEYDPRIAKHLQEVIKEDIEYLTDFKRCLK